MERIPILRLGSCLLVTVQVDLDDRLAAQLESDLTERVTRTGARGVLIDISALDVVDSFIGRTIAQIAAVTRLLDAHTVLVGMQPAVAITLVELGVPMHGVQTALDPERAMRMLQVAMAGDGFDPR